MTTQQSIIREKIRINESRAYVLIPKEYKRVQLTIHTHFNRMHKKGTEESQSQLFRNGKGRKQQQQK